jgi:hypothetical protein
MKSTGLFKYAGALVATAALLLSVERLRPEILMTCLLKPAAEV